MHWFTPLLREKIQMKVLVRINNLQLFVLWVLSYIHHPCPVTFWSRVSDQSGREGACFFAIIPILWSHFKIDLPIHARFLAAMFYRHSMTNCHLSVCLYVLTYLALRKMMEIWQETLSCVFRESERTFGTCKAWNCLSIADFKTCFFKFIKMKNFFKA